MIISGVWDLRSSEIITESCEELHIEKEPMTDSVAYLSVQSEGARTTRELGKLGERGSSQSHEEHFKKKEWNNEKTGNNESEK
jgi:hypothetical protein